MSLDTRERILQSAMELFATKGYASTSIDEVLRRSAAKPGSLYHFFPGKEDLLLAVLDAYREGIDEMLLQPAWIGYDDPIERVFALLARYRMLIVATDCEYGCPIGSLALEMHKARKPVRERISANFAAWTDAVHRCYLDAADRFEAGTNLRELAEFTLTTMEGGVMQSRTFRDVSYFDRSVKQLRQYVHALMKAPTRRVAAPKKRVGH
jgi:TetR/AcrR family transcriptional regulator, transcriptional repressor for nem operon